MKNFKIYFTCLALIAFSNLNAQIQYDNTATATAMAQQLFPGATVSNAVLVCPENGAGTFTLGTDEFGIEDGIVLTNGEVDEGEGGGQALPGDDDLTALSQNNAACDACVLTFDVVPNATSVAISFVFATGEGGFCTFFDDASGIFVSGPNPDGGSYTNQNVGITANGDPVTVRTVAQISCDGTDNSDIVVIGMSDYFRQHTVITNNVALNPTATYSFKMGVQDGGDCIVNSGLYVSAAIQVAETVPTMSEWGLFLFLFVNVILAVVVFYNMAWISKTKRT